MNFQTNLALSKGLGIVLSWNQDDGRRRRIISSCPLTYSQISEVRRVEDKSDFILTWVAEVLKWLVASDWRRGDRGGTSNSGSPVLGIHGETTRISIEQSRGAEEPYKPGVSLGRFIVVVPWHQSGQHGTKPQLALSTSSGQGEGRRKERSNSHITPDIQRNW
jgi:hypothetical protein